MSKKVFIDTLESMLKVVSTLSKSKIYVMNNKIHHLPDLLYLILGEWRRLKMWLIYIVLMGRRMVQWWRNWPKLYDQKMEQEYEENEKVQVLDESDPFVSLVANASVVVMKNYLRICVFLNCFLKQD